MSAEHEVKVEHGPINSWWYCVTCNASDIDFHVPAAAEDSADQHRQRSAADPPKDAA